MEYSKNCPTNNTLQSGATLDEGVIAECVGLWLAEGCRKTNREITFTNSQFCLIEHFHCTITKLFQQFNFRTRIYVYTPHETYVPVPLEVDKVNRYIHPRATRPYFIWRLASVHLTSMWKNIVHEYMNDVKYYPCILRGFFAGEGHVKMGSKCSRILRVSQNKDEFVEKLLSQLGISFSYTPGNRCYNISSKWNWDIFARLRIADLHPEKKERFWGSYREFNEEHYPNHFLRNAIMEILIEPKTSKELSVLFSRSHARVTELVVDLKSEKLIREFKVGSHNYWIRNDQRKIIVSHLKERYLNLVKQRPLTTTQMAKYFNVDYKSSLRRLKELEKLGLVTRDPDKTWVKLKVCKEVVVL